MQREYWLRWFAILAIVVGGLWLVLGPARSTLSPPSKLSTATGATMDAPPLAPETIAKLEPRDVFAEVMGRCSSHFGSEAFRFCHCASMNAVTFLSTSSIQEVQLLIRDDCGPAPGAE